MSCDTTEQKWYSKLTLINSIKTNQQDEFLQFRI